MSVQLQNAAVAVGLVLIGLLGLVVLWKVTKSLVKLFLWVAALLALTAGALWLLVEGEVIPKPSAWFAPAARR